jgi:hypothetical protein
MTKGGKPFSSDIEAFVESFAKDIADGTAAIFAGAGLSVASGYVNWAELLRDIAQELDLDIDKEVNLVAVAQYHLNARGNRTKINQKIIDEFSAGHSVNENHRVLARLPIPTFWTTNYDRMIESALEANGKVVDVKHSAGHLRHTQRGRQAVLYKMHGDVSDPDHAVLTKDDYEGYFRDREPFVTALTGDLTSKTFLFIGFSFTDPNIDYVMSRVRIALRKQTKQHYCIIRRESRRPREKKSSYEYRRRQQEYFVKDLARIGVHALMIDDYSHVTKILEAIERRFRRKTVFISGSAHDFSPLKSDEAAKLIEKISGALIRAGFCVSTGFGLGVGPSVISGALQEIYANPRKYPLDRLKAKPFPINVTASSSRARIFRQHREAVLAEAGMVVFLFGNKRDTSGKIVLADGVLEEYAIAKSQGLQSIAVGSTGWAAEKIAGELSGHLTERSKAFRAAFSAANGTIKKGGMDAISDAVVSMAKEYSRV